MERDELPVDEGADRQRVEAGDEGVVDLLVVFREALLTEIEVGGHLPALVVAAQHDDRVRVVDFQREEGDDDFGGENAAVDVVS